jgi:hypothetical protein
VYQCNAKEIAVLKRVRETALYKKKGNDKTYD